MTILLIGGTGVLSSAVTYEALSQGMEVTMVNRGKRTIPEGVELIKADKDDLKTIEQFISGRQFDAVIDFLCYTDEATRKSVEFYKHYTKQYFFISSCAVYNTAELNGAMADEKAPKELPIWKYSIDKWASEQLLISLLKDSDVNYTIIRPSVTYGDTRIPYGIMPPYRYHWTLIARILSGKPVITWNEGRNRCNMTRVEDFAVGVVGLIGNPKAYNEAFNVCGDETPSFKEVLDCVSDIIGHPVRTIDITPDFYGAAFPSKRGEIIGGRAIDAVNSNQKLKAAVPAFKQTIGLKEGLKKTIEAYKSQNYQLGIDWKFDATTDRIIRLWCKNQGIDVSQYKLGYVDYLNEGNNSNKKTYNRELNKDKFIYKLVAKIKRFFK